VTELPGELEGDRRLRSASAATWPAIDTEQLRRACVEDAMRLALGPGQPAAAPAR